MTTTATYNKSAFLGNYPAHWQVLRAKYLFDNIDERSEFGSEELLSVSEHHGVIKRKNANVNMFMAENYEGYKLCQKGDLVINSLWAWSRGLGFSEEKGIVSTAYGVFRPKKEKLQGINYRYFHHLLRTKLYVGEFGIRSKGIWISRLLLADKNFLEIPIIIPPIEEQNFIVNYLDTQSQKISHFITQKQQFIALLKEQKQSIINEAVTKGINKKVKLKNTGIEWLGDVPEHWEVRRLGSIGKFSKGGNVSKADLIEDGEFAVVLYGDIYTKYEFSVKDVVNRINNEVAVNAVLLSQDDILFTGSGEDKNDIGKCIAFKGIEETYAGGDVIIFQQNEFDSEFISYSQNSTIAKHQKYISSKGDIIVHTYASKLKDVKMPFPKSIQEQQQIVAHIKKETSTIDTAKAKAEKEIELIKEYKEAMIAEAVMGKVNFNKL